MSQISQAHFDTARLRFYDKLRDCNFSKAQRFCLFSILRRSWDIGLTRAWIPKLEYFTNDNDFEDGHLHKPDASIALRDLRRMLVIQEEPRFLYGINVLFYNWKVKELKPKGQLFMRLDGGPVPDLPEALRLTFVELGQKVLPACATGVSQGVDPGHIISGRDVDLRREDHEPTSPQQPGSPTGRAQEGKPPGHSGSSLEQSVSVGATAQISPSVSKILTTGSDVFPWGVSKILTTAISRRENASETGAVRKILTTPEPPTQNPPCAPVVQEVQQVQGLNELQRNIEDPVQRARARGVRKILTVREHVRLEDLVRGWVGDEDMQRSWRLWIEKAIRNFPDDTDYTVRRLMALERDHADYFRGKTPQERQAHKIKVLVVALAKQAGVSSWKKVRPGPEPFG